jgi:hypothetical protein
MEDINNCDETQVFKTKIIKNIPIEYDNLKNAKKSVILYIESNLVNKYDEVTETILLKYSNIKLTQKLASLIGEESHLVARIKYSALIFKPKINTSCFAKITNISKSEILLSFFDLIKGVVLIEKDVLAFNENLNSSHKANHNNNNNKDQLLRKEYLFEESSFKELSGSSFGLLKNQRVSVKLEVDKMVRVTIKDRVCTNDGEIILICDISLNNLS